MKLKGKRTYIALGAIVIHQILKSAGIDIPDESISTLLDVTLTCSAGLFRYLANQETK